MKLKKIASLALAGIMAVSMLAGCKGNESSSSDSNSTATVTSSDSADVASVLNNERSDYAKNTLEMSYKANTSLEEMLKAIVADKYGKDSDKLEALNTNGNYTGAAYTCSDEIVAELSDKVIGGIDGWMGTMPTSAGTYKYARVYSVGGGYTAKEAANLVTKYNLNATVAGNALENGTWLPLTATGFRADYTAEVAAVKMTSNAHPDESVWFIAVLYTQNVTKA